MLTCQVSSEILMKCRLGKTIPIFILDKREKQVYTVFADSVKGKSDYTNLRRKHSWSVSYILCVELLVLLETQMQLIF